MPEAIVTGPADDRWASEPDPRPISLVRPPGLAVQALHDLAEAADCLLVGEDAKAQAAVERAGLTDLNQWFHYYAQSRAMWRHLGLDPALKRLRVAGDAPAPDSTSAATKRELFAGDGWHCRFCSVPVIVPDARRILSNRTGLQWGRTNLTKHGGMLVMLASHDHVLPRSHGGSDDLANLVTACWPCQFSRCNALIEACGLADPRDRPPVHDDWDGLTRLTTRRS